MVDLVARQKSKVMRRRKAAPVELPISRPWLADDDNPSAPGEHYQSIVCTAFARLHFVNRKTGRVLGQKEVEVEK
jgi:hypothetical protein